MKKILLLKLGISLLFVLTLLLFLTLNYRAFNKNKKISEKIEFIPKFEFIDLNYESYKNEDLPNDCIVFIFFNSECDLCQAEIAELMKDANSFDQVSFLLVSNEPIKILKKFSANYYIRNSFVNLFHCDYTYFKDVFGVNIIPTIFIYNKNHKLIRILKGKMRINELHRIVDDINE